MRLSFRKYCDYLNTEKAYSKVLSKDWLMDVFRNMILHINTHNSYFIGDVYIIDGKWMFQVVGVDIYYSIDNVEDVLVQRFSMNPQYVPHYLKYRLELFKNINLKNIEGRFFPMKFYHND